MSRIDSALKSEGRCLPFDTLAKLLAKHRGKRNIGDLPELTIEGILGWADAYYRTTGKWPIEKSGRIKNTNDTWAIISSALRRGIRGLRGESSLAILLSEHRGKRNVQDLPTLTVEQILNWADAHHEANGKWPTRNSGQVSGTGETWSRIHGALTNELRGLSGGTTLAKLLAKHRGKRNTADLPDLTIPQILDWVDTHHRATGEWPNVKSGAIDGTGENWSIVDDALRRGIRGLRGDSSLPRLLATHRNSRARRNSTH